jgi:SAM-dependent methyltransferase/uncharacterized protein YbaR (Trm112 family)
MTPALLEVLACPRDRQRLTWDGDCRLECPDGHVYPVIDGVPVLLVDEAAPTIGLARASAAAAERALAGEDESADRLFVDSLGLNDDERTGIRELARRRAGGIDPAVAFLVGATNGIAYRGMIGTLDTYPIPTIRLPPAAGLTFLDVGCSWGRWCIAAARRGYRAIGIDPSLGAVLAASRVARELGVPAEFVVADARALPLAANAVDVVFSYSVIQHFAPVDAELAVAEAGRVLRAGGRCLIQMPTRWGLRCVYHQARRRFRAPSGFDVRYWTIPSLRRLFETRVGPARMSVDCYFGIGLQAADRHLLPLIPRLATSMSEALRAISRRVPALVYAADSVYVDSVKHAARADRR